MSLKRNGKKYTQVCFLFTVLFIALSCYISPVYADGYPPYWDNSTGAVHYKVLPWPTDAQFASQYYTHQGIPIIDKRIADPSNGGRAPQNYANVSSSCTSVTPDQVTPSVAWYFNSDTGNPSPEPTLFFRWLVEQIPNTYATGPTTQPFSNVDPFFAAQWTVLIDIDGDGFREFAVNIAGMSGNPSEPIDVMKSIYSNTRSQSIDYAGDPQIYYLFHQPTAFVYNSYGAGDPYLAYDEYILNFRNSMNPIPVWSNGSAETIWDYGSTRVMNVSNDTCKEFIVDYQIPLDMLDATSVGGPKVTEFTPMCLAFVTANSNQNPLQKDVAFNGTKSFTPEDCVPCGDLITPAGGVIPQPIVTEVTSTGCGPTNFTARVRDAINLDCTSTLASGVNAPTFYIYYDKNGNGIADDSQTWTSIGQGTVSASDPSLWTLTYNTSTLNRGQYLVGVRAQDTDSTVHITWSFLTQAEVDAGTPPASAGQYANPTPEPGVVMDSFLNSCGEAATLTKSVSPSYTSAGGVVTFTLSLQNSTSSSFIVSSITDMLPAGFSFQNVAPPVGAAAEGGTLAPAIATRPADGATGNVTWTFNAGNPAATIAAGGTGTLTFTTQVAPDAGTYTNSATAVTNDPDWGSLTSNIVDISVGAPQLTIAKRPSVYKANPGDTVTYTLTYSNDSPVNTTGVVITDVLPAGLNFIAASDGGTYDAANRTITWNLGNLTSGEGPYTVTYQVMVDQGANPRTENTATIDSNETSPATAKTAIYVPSPLEISKTANKALVDPRGVSPANQVIYTISYRNTGLIALTGTTITDTTMPSFTYNSCTGGCTTAEPSGDGYGDDDGTCEASEPCTVTWNIGNLASGASGSVTLTLTVANPYPDTLDNPATNTATIDTNETGPFSDSASVVIREYDCGATKDWYYFHDLDASGLPAPWTGVAPGTPLPATQKKSYATETAPVSPVATVITADFLPGTNPGPEIELAHFYQDPPLDQASGFSITGTVDMQVYISKDAGGPVQVIGYLYDYDPDTGEAIQIGTQAADSGNGSKTNVMLTFSITPLGIVREGNLLMWRFTTQRTSGNFEGNLYLNYDSTGSPSNGQVCFAPLSITMNKTVNLLEASPGTALVYTMTFTNSGQRDVTGATIVDTLPAGVTFTSATMNGTAMTSNCPTPGLNQYCASGQSYTFEAHTSGAAAGTLAGGGTGTLVVNVTINNPLVPSTITSLTNIARLYNNSTDPVEDDATTDITHTPTPDVFLQKSADKTLLNPGDTVTYTITVVNVGDATANNIVVSDTIPSDTYFTYVAGSISGGDSRSDAGLPTLTWTVNSLSSGSTATLTFRMLVASSGLPAGVTYKNNFASATEATTSPPNSNTVTVAITANANLALTKTVSSPVYTAGVGTGDGTTKIFNSILANIPVQTGTVEVFVAGTSAGIDSSTGTIIGGGLSGSTIDYSTGALHLEFLTAPVNGAAITATYRQELAPGATVQYTLVINSNGGSTATGVVVYDPIPAGASYVAGTLLYDAAVQTDQSGDDNAHYDGVANRVVFTPGNMAVDTSHTLKFSVLLDGTFGDGSTTVTNTGTAQATNTASKSDSASVVVTTAPDLTLSKAAPTLVPYPLAVLNGNHTATTTLTLTNPPGSRYFNIGDRIYVNGLLRIVTSIVSATQITVDQTVTAGGGTQVIPVIKYTLSYANTGTASAPNVIIKDILPANLNYLSATPAPTTAPAYNTNGILTWNLGTLAQDAVGTIVVYTRPTATGTYSNTATMSGSTVPSFPSNTVVTTAGALELDKSTSTPTVVKDGAPDIATYVIRVRNPFTATSALGIQVTDYLPQGFTYATTTSFTGCSGVTSNPVAGATRPVWGCTILAAGATITITFNVNITAPVSAGTYQNPVTATSTNLNVLPFDELITTAEDVTVTIPGDITVSKAITAGPIACVQGMCVDYRITARNLGSGPATNISIKDTDTDGTTYPPAFLTYVSDNGGGTYNSGTGIWTIGGPLAANASATLDIRFSISALISTINNCVTRTASTPADTNAGNDRYCVPLIPTLITLSDFSVMEENGRVVVRWETSSEIDTIGFYLYRFDRRSGKYIQINNKLLPAVLTSQQGGSYSLIDDSASLSSNPAYLLVEVERSGKTYPYGPFTAQAGVNAPMNSFSRSMSARDLISGTGTNNGSDKFSGYTRKEHPISNEKKTRIKASKEEKASARLERKIRSGNAIKMIVRDEGLYYVEASEISNLLGISYSEVRGKIMNGSLILSNHGNLISYIPFDDFSGLYFYGQGIDSIYTKENVYWLSKGKGLHMETLDSGNPAPSGYSTFTEMIHVEEDRLLVPALAENPEEDYWFWNYIISGNDSLGRRTFSIPSTGSTTSGTATLTVNLHGFTNTSADPDHHVAVSINGAAIGEGRWEGTDRFALSLNFSQSLLYDGNNTVEVRGILDSGAPYSMFYIDSFDLAYEKLHNAHSDALTFSADGHQTISVYGFASPDISVFDISNPQAPKIHIGTTIGLDNGSYRVTFNPSSPDGRYLATTAGTARSVQEMWADLPSRLAGKNNRADYLIIAPASLINASKQLAGYRASKGLLAMTIDMEDIMDEFNYGIYSPVAIRDFLKYAYYNWEKAPGYVVLAGEGTFDYKDNLGIGDNLVPTLMTYSPMTLAPSDNIFGDVNDDYIPEIAIGRLSVLTSEELGSVTSKIISYETNKRKKIIMAADNPDDGGNFTVDSNAMASLVPAGYPLEKIYLSAYPVEYARQMLIDQMNNGARLVNYIGHSGVDRFASEGLLRISDLTLLKNSAGLPVVTAMTCSVGKFAIPGYDSLSEALVLKKDGGAVAVWAPTGLSYNSLSVKLDEGFFRNIFRKDRPVLGDAILDAFRRYSRSGGSTFVIDIYNLQGDPALKMW